MEWKKLKFAENKRAFEAKEQELKLNQIEQELKKINNRLSNLEGTNKTRETWIAMILDESGSMKRYTTTTISAINEYFEDRIKDSKELNQKMLVFLNKFGGRVRPLHTALPVEDYTPLTNATYFPEGSTALYDAVGCTIEDMDKRMSDMKTKPRVLCVILTDGEENASTIYNGDRIRSLIKAKTEEGNYTFLFLGSCKDPLAQAREIGIRPGVGGQNVNSFNNKGIYRAAAAVSGQTRSFLISPDSSSNVFNPNGTMEDMTDLIDDTPANN